MSKKRKLNNLVNSKNDDQSIESFDNEEKSNISSFSLDSFSNTSCDFVVNDSNVHNTLSFIENKEIGSSPSIFRYREYLNPKQLEKLDFIYKKRSSSTAIVGKHMFHIPMYIYLCNRYKNVGCINPCIEWTGEFDKAEWKIYESVILKGVKTRNMRKTNHIFPKIKIYNELFFSDEIIERFITLKNNSSIDYIFGIIILSYEYYDFKFEKLINESHANSFIYSKKDNCVEIFEPEGSKNSNVNCSKMQKMVNLCYNAILNNQNLNLFYCTFNFYII